MSLIDKVNTLIRKVARDCALKCSKKIPPEFSAFLQAVQQSEESQIFFTEWPDAWPEQPDEIIDEVMERAFQIFCQVAMPDLTVEENDDVIQKYFLKFYSAVFKQGKSIARDFNSHFKTINNAMETIAQTIGSKYKDYQDAPHDPEFFDDEMSAYQAFAMQVYQYIS